MTDLPPMTFPSPHELDDHEREQLAREYEDHDRELDRRERYGDWPTTVLKEDWTR